MEKGANSSKTKKILLIGGLTLDACLTIFLFIISILMLVRATTMTRLEIETAPNDCIVNWLAKRANLPVFLGAIVVPLFILLAANIVFLVLYIRKTNKPKSVNVNDLSNDQIEALKKELLNDLSKDNTKENQKK